MIDYIIGEVREVGIDYLVIENNNVGYRVTIGSPNGYQYGERIRLHTYLQVKEDAFVLYGFKQKEDKNLFLRLINVSGLGPKTAIGMFANCTAQQLIQAIETSNTAFLKKLPGIGPKAAQQIILDLKGKLVMETDNVNSISKTNSELQDARDALRALGFKVVEIDAVLAKIGMVSATSEEYIRQALKMLNR